MTRRRAGLVSILALLLVAVGTFIYIDARERVSIAYVTSGETIVGQVGAVLRHTEILRQNRIRPVFLTTPSLGEFRRMSMLADVILTGEADPAIRIGMGQRGRIVGTLGVGGKYGLVVPPNSKAQTVADLKGANIATTLGDSLQRWLISTCKEAGLREEDITIEEYRPLLSEADPQVGALVIWEPILPTVIAKGFRQLKGDRYYTTVFFSERFLLRREKAVDVMVALKQAAWYVSQHHAEVNQWYREGEQMRIGDAALDEMSRGNELYTASSPSSFSLRPDRLDLTSRLMGDLQFLSTHGFVGPELTLDTLIDPAPATEADRRF